MIDCFSFWNVYLVFLFTVSTTDTWFEWLPGLIEQASCNDRQPCYRAPTCWPRYWFMSPPSALMQKWASVIKLVSAHAKEVLSGLHDSTCRGWPLTSLSCPPATAVFLSHAVSFLTPPSRHVLQSLLQRSTLQTVNPLLMQIPRGGCT